jgi:hypothetical protein
MTKARFLAEADSLEVSEWMAYFTVKSEIEKDRRESAEFERRLSQGQ